VVLVEVVIVGEIPVVEAYAFEIVDVH